MKLLAPTLPVLLLCLVATSARLAADPTPVAAPNAVSAPIPATPSTPTAPHHRRLINNFVPFIPPLTPEQVARFRRADEAKQDGDAALKAGDAVGAASRYRDSLADAPDGQTYVGLAEALTAQGKTQEAIQTYGTLFNPGPNVSYGGSYMTRAGLRYALLLNQAGQWAEALHRYQEALIAWPVGDMSKINLVFSPDEPQPVALAAAANLALGMSDSFTFSNNGRGDGATLYESDRAFQEFRQALRLAPNWDLANYYYGYGWQQLSPASRQKLGSLQQARAALLKAVRIGKGDVKKAAQKALRVAMNTK